MTRKKEYRLHWKTKREPIQRLWCAVLLQALKDLETPSKTRRKNHGGSCRPFLADKLDAYEFFFSDKRRYDLEIVCEIAGMNLQAVLQHAEKIKSNQKAVLF